MVTNIVEQLSIETLLKMSGAGAGHEYPSEPVSWLKRDVLLFNYSIGCKPEEELHFIYVSLMDNSESFLMR